MPNFFLAGRELVQWDLEIVDDNGPYRLTMRHGRGAIVEYFKDTTAALVRERELESLLTAARALGHPAAVNTGQRMPRQ